VLNQLLSLCCLLLQLAMHCEAERLAGASFGVTLLHCIGRVYSRQAEIYLGGLLGKPSTHVFYVLLCCLCAVNDSTTSLAVPAAASAGTCWASCMACVECFVF
jgi:hypothetical protein